CVSTSLRVIAAIAFASATVSAVDGCASSLSGVIHSSASAAAPLSFPIGVLLGGELLRLDPNFLELHELRLGEGAGRGQLVRKGPLCGCAMPAAGLLAHGIVDLLGAHRDAAGDLLVGQVLLQDRPCLERVDLALAILFHEREPISVGGIEWTARH